METSKFDDDYTQHVYVMLTRKPGKRFLKRCFELSNYTRTYDMTVMDHDWNTRYIKIAINRLHLGTLRGIPKVLKLLKLSAHMEDRPRK